MYPLVFWVFHSVFSNFQGVFSFSNACFLSPRRKCALRTRAFPPRLCNSHTGILPPSTGNAFPLWATTCRNWDWSSQGCKAVLREAGDAFLCSAKLFLGKCRSYWSLLTGNSSHHTTSTGIIIVFLKEGWPKQSLRGGFKVLIQCMTKHPLTSLGLYFKYGNLSKSVYCLKSLPLLCSLKSKLLIVNIFVTISI